MKNWQKIFLFFFSALMAVSCVEPYEPTILSEDHHYLVVEGFLNSGTGPSQIRLSRTVGLKDTDGYLPEAMAVVSVESENGRVYNFQESFGGTYLLEPIDLDHEDKYRLKVLTAEGKEYLSDYVEVRKTPPIDSISWKREDSGVQLFVNTHDPENKSWYYRWEYEEAWEYNVPYSTYLMYKDGGIVQRPFPTPYKCWRFGVSTSLLLGSSAKLRQDVISMVPLTFIPNADRKLSSRYSILVKQYVLSRQAFEYYQQMEKNSEELGSFFDPQPSEVKGNLRSTDSPDEPVIGFFSVGSEEQKRIFIESDDVPMWGFRHDCVLVEVQPEDVRSTFGGGGLMPVFEGKPGVYFGVIPSCADCSLSASTERPDYW